MEDRVLFSILIPINYLNWYANNHGILMNQLKQFTS